MESWKASEGLCLVECKISGWGAWWWRWCSSVQVKGCDSWDWLCSYWDCTNSIRMLAWDWLYALGSNSLHSDLYPGVALAAPWTPTHSIAMFAWDLLCLCLGLELTADRYLAGTITHPESGCAWARLALCMGLQLTPNLCLRLALCLGL